jgi:hypothetical protein
MDGLNPEGVAEYDHFGTDAFVDFCRSTGAQPQICLNLGSGTVEEAAEWVKYVNTHWGAAIWAAGIHCGRAVSRLSRGGESDWRQDHAIRRESQPERRHSIDDQAVGIQRELGYRHVTCG